MKRSTVDTDIHMSFLEAGKGPLVILCHGFPETAYAWRHQIKHLAEAGFRAVAPDMRGYGNTDAPWEVNKYSLMHVTGDIVGLMDRLECERAVIVGNDWGSTVAWHAARLRPDRVAGVAALGVPLMGRAPLPPTQIFPRFNDLLFYTLYFQEEGLAEKEFETDIRTTLLKVYYAASGEAGARQEGDGTPNPFGMVNVATGLLSPLPLKQPQWLTDADMNIYVEAFTRSGFRGGLNYYRNLDTNWEHDLALQGVKIEIPAIYLTGERDTGLSIPGMKDIIEYMPNLAPKLRYIDVFDGAGHWLQQERPEEVSQDLCRFIEKVI